MIRVTQCWAFVACLTYLLITFGADTAAAQDGACCRDNGSCLLVSQATCESYPDGEFGGAGSTCFAGRCRGACCRPTGECLAGSARFNCEGTSGAYLGHGSTCDGANCPVLPNGACCFEFYCRENYTEKFCTSRGAGYMGDDSTCGDCPGACCLTDDSCLDSTQGDCAMIEGASFAGNFTTCPPDGCREGACCFATVNPDGECTGPVDPFNCASSHGLFLGAGTDCATSTCPPFGGACCPSGPSGSCFVTTEEDCLRFASPDYVYLEGVDCGVASECPPALGACCYVETILFPLGTCDDLVTEAECDALQGHFRAGKTCDVEGICTGGCCSLGGSCVIEHVSICLDSIKPNVYRGDGTGCCDDENQCNGLETCDTNGDCQSGTAPICDDGVPCTVDGCDPSTGCTRTPDDSLCFDEDECTLNERCDPDRGCVSDTKDCSDAHDCTVDRCVSPTGECANDPVDAQCDDGKSCTIDTCDPNFGCLNGADDSKCDDGVDCTRNECIGDQPGADAEGCAFPPDDSLCPSTDLCVPRRCDSVAGCRDEPRECPDDGDPCTREYCDSADGECKSDEFCGACCVLNDQCRENVTQEFCETTLGGSFMGAGSECITVPCGACCEFDTGVCIDGVTLSECDRIDGVFKGSDSICQPDSCAGACCDRGFVFPDCYDNRTAEQCAQIDDDAVFAGAGTDCASAPCGACCGPLDSYCEDVVPGDLCIQEGGSYQGDGSVCIPNPCEGACCMPDGTCAVTLADECPGDYQGTGSACDELDPPCAPFAGGACCLDLLGEFCVDGTSAQTCVNAYGGDYQGEGSQCGSVDCTATGACCDDEGVCEQYTETGCDTFEAVTGVSTVFLGTGVPCGGPNMNECAPTGACCRPDGSCIVTIEEACAGVYRGDNTACDELNPPCQPSETTGACCRSSEGCIDNVLPADCDGGFRTFMGIGTICETAPCGACCDNARSSCFDGRTQSGCESTGGTFQGPGSECTARLCDGACCYADGSCVVIDGASCAGDFRGSNTACDELNPPCESFAGGACCLFNGDCVDGTTLATCHGSLRGTHQGDGTICETVDCLTTGACCRSDLAGFCSQTTEEGCASLSVRSGSSTSFLGYGVPCNVNWLASSCPKNGACCLPDGSCVVRRKEDCPGLYRGDGTACDELNPPCEPFSLGACCTNDGICIETTDASCFFGGGIYEGDGTACTDTDCLAVGACCYSFDDPSDLDAVTFACAQTTRRACEQALPALGAIFGFDAQVMFLGEGVPCEGIEGDTCPAEIGACCLSDGSCTVTTGEGCRGQYRGDGTACDELNPPCEPFGVGACCLQDDSCIGEVTADYCIWTRSGDYQGDDTTCAGINCPAKGACCISFMSPFTGEVRTECYQTTQAACSAAEIYLSGYGFAAQSVFLGEGVPCEGADADVCPAGDVGACCHPDGTCAVEAEDQCAGDFRGAATACDELNPPCQPFVSGACCILDGSCIDGTSPLGCTFARAGLYQGDLSTCAESDCLGPAGACCYEFTLGSEMISGCDNLSRAACEGAHATFLALGATGYSVYLGDGTSCEGPAGDQCPEGIPFGACCLPDGSCVVRRPIDCPFDYRGDGTACDEISPACTPVVGACCVDGRGCLADLTQAECTGEGGTFLGDGVSCADSDCGVCCSEDNQTCFDGTFRIDCLAASGTFKGSAAQCATVDCCVSNDECQDGEFCNGSEACVAGRCIAGERPCDPETESCDEVSDLCVLICNGAKPCDLDGDGRLTLLDYGRFMVTFGRDNGGPLYNLCADYDGDNAITRNDYRLWLECTATP